LTGSGPVPAGSGLASAGSGLAAALRAALDRELSDAVRLRHELHAAPELSGSEYQTAARVADALGEPDAPQVAGTGRLVRIGPADGPCVAVRAELDALPVVEQTGAPRASANGAMHACGHDVHLAAASWPVLREAGFAIDTSFRSCGADDFSFYSPVAPILMLFVGSGGTVTLHHPKFLPPDEAVGQVATVMLAGYLAALTLLLFARLVGGSRRAVHSKTI
jgi:metal-dependent amidase/aminoacylase/carboxypeptidase family protein